MHLHIHTRIFNKNLYKYLHYIMYIFKRGLKTVKVNEGRIMKFLDRKKSALYERAPFFLSFLCGEIWIRLIQQDLLFFRLRRHRRTFEQQQICGLIKRLIVEHPICLVRRLSKRRRSWRNNIIWQEVKRPAGTHHIRNKWSSSTLLCPPIKSRERREKGGEKQWLQHTSVAWDNVKCEK